MSAHEEILSLFDKHELVTIAIIRANLPEMGSSTVRSALARLRHKGIVSVAQRTGSRHLANYKLSRIVHKPVSAENTVVDECRQNWSGYHIHKIFGSTSRRLTA